MITKGQNPNRPAKGSMIKVEPIKERDQIDRIKAQLAAKPLDLAMFVVGINTNLRASDLLRIRVRHVKWLKPGEAFELTEQKTGKKRRVNLNGACVSAIQGLLAVRDLADDEFLFTGQRGRITVPALNLKVKNWCLAAGCKGNFGSHTLRKTWGYHQRVTFGVDIARLMVCFNHASPKQTLEYLCIQPEEISEVYKNEL